MTGYGPDPHTAENFQLRIGGSPLLKNRCGGEFGFCFYKDDFGSDFRHVKGLGNTGIPATAHRHHLVGIVTPIAETAVKHTLPL